MAGFCLLKMGSDFLLGMVGVRGIPQEANMLKEDLGLLLLGSITDRCLDPGDLNLNESTH